MYGPGASDKKQLKMLLVPVKNEKSESNILHSIFADAMLISLPDAESHDRAIAVVLSLPYFANIVFAKSIAGEDIHRLKQVAGTTFTLQSLLAESVLTDEPDLIAALIRESPSSRREIKRFLREAESTAKLAYAKSGNLVEDIRKLKSRLQKHQKLEKSYKRLYDILESVSG
jgi:prephenate dehydrogenase